MMLRTPVKRVLCYSIRELTAHHATGVVLLLLLAGRLSSSVCRTRKGAPRRPLPATACTTHQQTRQGLPHYPLPMVHRPAPGQQQQQQMIMMMMVWHHAWDGCGRKVTACVPLKGSSRCVRQGLVSRAATGLPPGWLVWLCVLAVLFA